MKTIRLLGNEADRIESFYWMITHMNMYSIEKDEFQLSDKDYKKFRIYALFKRFKYKVKE